MKNLVEVIKKWGFGPENTLHHSLTEEEYDEMYRCAQYNGLCTVTLFIAFDRELDGTFRLAQGFWSWDEIERHLKKER